MFFEHPFGVGTGALPSLEGLTAGGIVGQVLPDRETAHLPDQTLAENASRNPASVAYVASFTFSGWRQRHDGMLRLGMLVTGVFAVAFISTEFREAVLVVGGRSRPVALSASRGGPSA